MKKYKLIKKYPSIPSEIKEGSIAEETNMKNLYSIGVALLHINEIENYPEFWEEVDENSYKIISYSRNYNIDKDGVRSKTRQILSILRLYDNTKFSLGDRTNHGMIAEITEQSGKIIFNNNSDFNLLDYKPLKDVFWPSPYYFVDEENLKVEECRAPFTADHIKKYSKKKKFSSRKKAEYYLINNSKIFSINDIFKERDNSSKSCMYDRSWYYMLRKMAKKKLLENRDDSPKNKTK